MILQWLLSLAFVIQMYLVMAILALIVTPMALFNLNTAYWAIRIYCLWVRWSASVLVGLKSEIRGQIPSGNTLICAKHQSFFDILILCSVIRCPRFVMKREILRLPIVGYYAKRIGCIPIDRGKGSIAVQQMLKGVSSKMPNAGPLIIYPQGTRVNPGVKRRYKMGAGILYELYETGCTPVATNVGVFWPKAAILRKPGLAVVEFLPPIKGGKQKEEFMQELQDNVEHHSNLLMREGGFKFH